MITNAIPIASTTIAPATKLEIKFANEAVICKIPFLIIIKLKIVIVTTVILYQLLSKNLTNIIYFIKKIQSKIKKSTRYRFKANSKILFYAAILKS